MVSEIKNFYENKNVFVTGASGFLGKILLEQLLRKTGVAKIYVLMRDKKGKSAEKRVDDIFNDVVFEKVKNEVDGYRSKVKAIIGDCLLENLGICERDRDFLAEKIDVIFHVAATVRFNEKLRVAYAINFKATVECVNLCKKFKKLRAFVHVSTAYSNCVFRVIDEKFYEYPPGVVDREKIEHLLETTSDDVIEKQLKTILGEWPNTYVFTKALAEGYLKENSRGIPLSIFRPSIVISTYEEPVEGWIDNYNGPILACFKIATGELRVMHCTQNAIIDVIPVDSCASALLAIAWEVSKNGDCQKIYNYVSSPENPITFSEFWGAVKHEARVQPFLDHHWYITFVPISSKLFVEIAKVLLHLIPACFFDFFSIIFGQKCRHVKMYVNLHKYQDSVAYFCTRDWIFANKNVVELWSKMNPTDREIFAFSPKNINWLRYMKNYVKGLKVFLKKESLGDFELKVAKKRQKRFKTAHFILKALVYYASVVLINKIF